MPLFRRSEPERDRSPEDREYARRLREARRQGLPDPPRPDAEEAAAEGFAEPPPEPEAEPLAPEPEAEPLAPEPDPGPPEPELAAEPEPEPEPVANAPEPDHATAAPDWIDPDADDDLADWTEPVRERARPPDPEPAPVFEPAPAAEPAAAAADDEDEPPTRVWDEPPAPAASTGSASAAPIPGGLDDVPRQPPPLPASTSARPLPKAPRRRYSPAGARRTPAGPPARRRGRWLGRILAVLALVAVAFVLWFLFSLFQPGKGEGHGSVAVTIPQGATAREVGDLLADRGVVSSGFFFDLRARISGKRDDLKAGRFTLALDMSYAAAIDRLVHTPAAPPTVKVTIPEGRSRREAASVVKQAGIKGSYLSASVEHEGFSTRRYGAPRATKSLEGFLFPATYELRPSEATAANLVGQQLEAFKANIAKVSMTKARRANLTSYDVLIIASMVEREAQVAKERRLIAAVIYNRLKDSMPLGIDATTRYELGQWSRPLRVSELEKDTPYNTRTRRGLPPTPIGNPGLASIQAAADPASADYLYYVVKSGTCGQHSFSSDDAEFQRDVAAYEAARAKNGGKSPTTC